MSRRLRTTLAAVRGACGPDALRSSVIAATWLATPFVMAGDPCDDPADCCVNTATCVITDRETLAGLTINDTIQFDFVLGTYCAGGNGGTGIAPCPKTACGLNFCSTGESPAQALNTLDKHWLQSTTIPKVVDFGAPVNTAIVFVAVDHGPFPEEGIESTVWGSNTCDISNFPNGWTLATLTTIYQLGWEDPPQCQGQDNADDFTGQYSFKGEGFRYVAVHANNSISIFFDPSHTTWTTSDDNSGVPGWQSFDDEIDAIGTPTCAPGTVIADAGPDQAGVVGGMVCFDAAASFARNGIASIGWDLDGDNEIDVSGPVACVTCEDVSSGEVTVFVTDACGGVDSDTAAFECVSGGVDKGACCVPSGACGVVTPTKCAMSGGSFQGTGTSCVGVMCSQPVGACCQPDGGCGSLTQAECQSTGGLWQGMNVACDEALCDIPKGACCLGGITCGAMPETDCAAMGGTYLGDDTVCLTGTCPPAPQPDLDDDGMVGVVDLTILLANWGCSGVCPGDLNDDGACDVADLLMLLAAWGPVS